MIVSSWAAQKEFDPGNRQALWGSFGYTREKDVVRAPMKLEVLPHAVEEMTWEFLDVTNDGGLIALTWDMTRASVPFKVG